MDIDQLKKLAERLRTVVLALNVPITHAQSLDLAATIPGKRKWAEVVTTSRPLKPVGLWTQRLANRLLKDYDIGVEDGWIICVLCNDRPLKEAAEDYTISFMGGVGKWGAPIRVSEYMKESEWQGDPPRSPFPDGCVYKPHDPKREARRIEEYRSFMERLDPDEYNASKYYADRPMPPPDIEGTV